VSFTFFQFVLAFCFSAETNMILEGGFKGGKPAQLNGGGRRDNRGEHDKGVASWVARDGGWIRLGRESSTLTI
jgi:hypothetical protein